MGFAVVVVAVGVTEHPFTTDVMVAKELQTSVPFFLKVEALHLLVQLNELQDTQTSVRLRVEYPSVEVGAAVV